MFNIEKAYEVADEIDMERANMVEPRPTADLEPWHFSAEYKALALRHVWSINRAREAREAQERGFPRWI